MKGTSILWISSSENQRPEAKFGRLRAAGLMPVCVGSVEGALHLLGQFRVCVVVLHVSAGVGWEECARLLATGSVVTLILHSPDPEAVQRYLQAGCAAVLAESCPSNELVALLGRAAAGQRELVWPKNLLAAAV